MRYIELVLAQNWIDQAIEMCWFRRDVPHTVAYMHPWEDGVIPATIWRSRYDSIRRNENSCR